MKVAVLVTLKYLGSQATYRGVQATKGQRTQLWELLGGAGLGSDWMPHRLSRWETQETPGRPAQAAQLHPVAPGARAPF